MLKDKKPKGMFDRIKDYLTVKPTYMAPTSDTEELGKVSDSFNQATGYNPKKKKDEDEE